ncbi:hypothetical protein FPV67DRAFT_1108808 [Lyophyllum atratum]|nr:hypothetical protein FPV67DRAFT_1108808 [Lyophyllum atratum]
MASTLHRVVQLPFVSQGPDSYMEGRSHQVSALGYREQNYLGFAHLGRLRWVLAKCSFRDRLKQGLRTIPIKQPIQSLVRLDACFSVAALGILQILPRFYLDWHDNYPRPSHVNLYDCGYHSKLLGNNSHVIDSMPGALTQEMKVRHNAPSMLMDVYPCSIPAVTSWMRAGLSHLRFPHIISLEHPCAEPTFISVSIPSNLCLLPPRERSEKMGSFSPIRPYPVLRVPLTI